MKAKHLIIEGVNKTGKSSFIKDLNEIQLPFRGYYERSIRHKYHGTNFARQALDAQLATIVSFAKFSNENIIFDRLHLSEYVYGFVDRKYDCLREVLKYDKLLKEAGCYMVYLYDDVEKIKERMFGQQVAKFDKERRIEKLIKEFEFILQFTMLPLLCINYNDFKENKEGLAMEVNAFLG